MREQSKSRRAKRWAMVVGICCLVSGVAGATPQPVCAAEFTKDNSDGNWNAHDEDGFYYMIPAGQETLGTCILNVYGGGAADITLPKMCGAYQVTAVGKDFASMIQQFGAAFGNDKNSFTSVKIPDGYQLIESGDGGRTGAFQNQRALARIEIPESVTDIGENAFDGCDSKILTVVAPYGSVAHKYAKEHGFKYKNSVRLNRSSLSLKAGKGSVLKLRNTKQKTVWKSSDVRVAAVSSRGKVIARGAGTAKITAKAAGKTYVCTVTVK